MQRVAAAKPRARDLPSRRAVSPAHDHRPRLPASQTGAIWTVGTLAPNASSTITITAKVATDGDATRNFAEVWRSEQYDPDSTPANGEQGEDDETGLEVPVADLRVSQLVDVAGSNAVFRITVVNDGPDNASAITIKSPLLATNYTYVSHASTSGTYNNTTGDWTIPTLLDGASATLTVTTTFTSLSVSWAQVSAVNEVDPDSLPGNCLGTVATCLEDDDASAPAADLSVTQSVNNVNPNVGASEVFTITIRNSTATPRPRCSRCSTRPRTRPSATAT